MGSDENVLHYIVLSFLQRTLEWFWGRNKIISPGLEPECGAVTQPH